MGRRGTGLREGAFSGEGGHKESSGALNPYIYNTVTYAYIRIWVMGKCHSKYPFFHVIIRNIEKRQSVVLLISLKIN